MASESLKHRIVQVKEKKGPVYDWHHLLGFNWPFQQAEGSENPSRTAIGVGFVNKAKLQAWLMMDNRCRAIFQ